MALAPRSETVTLNIRLLKPGVRIEDAFRDNADADEVPTATPPGARLFIDRSRSRPSWSSLSSDLTTFEPDLSNCSWLFSSTNRIAGEMLPRQCLRYLCHHSSAPSHMDGQIMQIGSLSVNPINVCRRIVTYNYGAAVIYP